VTKVIIPAVLSRFLLRHTSFSFFFQWLRSLYRLCSRGSSYVTLHSLFFSVTKVVIPAVLSRFLLRHISFSFFQWLNIVPVITECLTKNRRVLIFRG